MFRRMLCMLMILLMVVPAASAEGEFPALNAQGFLDSGEFVYVNPDDGVWRYASSELRVDIRRVVETEPAPLTYIVAHVWSAGDEVWTLTPNKEGKPMSSTAFMQDIMLKNNVIVGISTDFAHHRYPKKNKSVGIVIRNGKVYSDKTREASFIGFPNLDVMAIYPDGSLMVYDSDEKTADEYLAMGAISTLAFGPYLVRGGEINYDGMKRINDYNNPRVALGMVEPGHTVALMVEGRHKASRGCKLPRLAEIMAAEGCTEAINLDGGASGCMVFMGEQINVVGGSKTKGGYARKGTELLGIGHSQLVQKYDVKTKK